MLISEQAAEADGILEVLDAPVRALGGRHVEEHQHHAGDGEDQQQRGGRGAEPERIVPVHAGARDFGREPVQPEIADDRFGRFAIALGRPRPDSLAPQPLELVAHGSGLAFAADDSRKSRATSFRYRLRGSRRAKQSSRTSRADAARALRSRCRRDGSGCRGMDSRTRCRATARCIPDACISRKSRGTRRFCTNHVQRDGRIESVAVGIILGTS